MLDVLGLDATEEGAYRRLVALPSASAEDLAEVMTSSLPTTLVGQLIVFETLAALAYAFLLRGVWPEPVTAAGIGLLVAGVITALRVRPQPLAAEAHPN